jgi:hypothetical protein
MLELLCGKYKKCCVMRSFIILYASSLKMLKLNRRPKSTCDDNIKKKKRGLFVIFSQWTLLNNGLLIL